MEMLFYICSAFAVLAIIAFLLLKKSSAHINESGEIIDQNNKYKKQEKEQERNSEPILNLNNENNSLNVKVDERLYAEPLTEERSDLSQNSQILNLNNTGAVFLDKDQKSTFLEKIANKTSINNTSKVVEYLLSDEGKQKGLSSKEAKEILKINQLKKIIFRLRNLGHNIELRNITNSKSELLDNNSGASNNSSKKAYFLLFK